MTRPARRVRPPGRAATGAPNRSPAVRRPPPAPRRRRSTTRNTQCPRTRAHPARRDRIPM
ncbi:hypothetical protein Rhow_007446 [Rhodococcus wratislaviensis]|uniref:Uncharacterized protein n=1 Tax=Rhodococcus wratislaviensis TaxID=44752 RepID=A0A402CIB7_RHOWR|nr:hypothetical protein Rhow_007446 [Rhodococcus wratislaviensis]